MTREKGSWAWALVLLLAAAGSIFNGIWMLLSPPHWYEWLPAAIPDFGPLNEHFVRDLGAVFVVLGAALIWAWKAPGLRFALLALVTGFYALHSMVHVFDTARGFVGAEHWWVDFPLIYLPTLLLGGLTVAAARQR